MDLSKIIVSIVLLSYSILVFVNDMLFILTKTYLINDDKIYFDKFIKINGL